MGNHSVHEQTGVFVSRTSQRPQFTRRQFDDELDSHLQIPGLDKKNPQTVKSHHDYKVSTVHFNAPQNLLHEEIVVLKHFLLTCADGRHTSA